MSEPSDSGSKLDPELRERLLKESRTPFRGIRRLIWIACFGSALIGFLIMSLRTIGGDVVQISDISIQVGALLIFGSLLFFDRSK